MDIKTLEDRYNVLAHDINNLNEATYEEFLELQELLNGDAYRVTGKGEKLDSINDKLAEKASK